MFNGLTPEAELAHEANCVNRGTELYGKRTNTHVQKGNESLAKYGKRVMQRSIEPLSAEIQRFLDRAGKGPGRKHLAVKYLAMLETDVSAFIAVNCAMNHVTTGYPYQRCACEVGRRIEDELRFRWFEDENSGWYKAVQTNLKQNPDGYRADIRRKTMVYSMNKIGLIWEKWSKETHFHIGSKLLELFIDSCGMFEIVREQARTDSKLYLRPTDAMLTWIEKFNEQAGLMCPRLQPMLCPPKPWTSVDDGGYHHPLLKQKLVKSASRGYQRELQAADMPEVYRAVNSLQTTAWKINDKVLATAKLVYNSGMAVDGLPSHADTQWVDLPEPEIVEGRPETKTAWSDWKFKIVEKRKFLAKSKSLRTHAYALIELGESFEKHEAIWFPVRCDFRSRMYYIPQYLNPQGSDLAKGLLTFAEGKSLGPTGARWLAIHLANNFGFDKVSMADRVKWVALNEAAILRVAEDPMAEQWWTEADKPWQFLAACFEWAAYSEQGPEFVSHLPVLVDGSCNGLQHFAAMLRDDVCGKYVNLVPGEKPGDIYAEVASTVEAALRLDTSATGSFPPADPKKGEVKNAMPIAELARKWLAHGISRALAKRPVMVLPYGGTQSAVVKYIAAYCLENGHPFGRSLNRAAAYLGGVFWREMAKVVVKPMEAMDWLRKSSRKIAAEGLPVTWTTPTKFVVCQRYMDINRRRVKTKIGEEIIKVTLVEDTDRLDKRRQATAIAPNFVHSLDASALMLTINAMSDKGVTAFSAVHDSYGTHAADMHTLAATLREVFFVLYSERDVLADFAAEVGDVLTKGSLDALPVRGRLELSDVLKSDFFFA